MPLGESSERLKQLEQDAREMGVPGDIIETRRPGVVERLKKEDEEELSKVRQLDEQRLRDEVNEFAARTSEDLSRNPETGVPLDQPSEQK